MDTDQSIEEETQLPSHYLLGTSPYSSLIEQKNQIVQQYSALESIVSTANMNPKVLMKESNLERRKILIRIDASATGESFLKQMIADTNDENNIFSERLVLGKMLQSKRKDLNTKLYLHQVEIFTTAVSHFHYLFLSLKQIKMEYKTARLAFYSFNPTSQKDYNEKLVLACLLDELIELKAIVTEEMKKTSQ